MLATVLLLVCVLVATATDVLRHKIYNWNTYGGTLAALAVSGARGVWTARDGSPDWADRWLTTVTLADSAWGLLVCGAMMVVCFVFFRGIGGGDVKLVAMMGAMLGWEKGLEAMLWTFVLGACAGMIALVWRVGPWQMASRVARLLATSLPRWLRPPGLGWVRPLDDEERRTLQPPIYLAPAGLVAAVIVKFELIR